MRKEKAGLQKQFREEGFLSSEVAEGEKKYDTTHVEKVGN